MFGNDDMLPNNYGYGDGEASAYSGMNEYGAVAASELFSAMPEQTAMTPQQDRPRMRVVPNPGEYGYAEFMAERAGVVIPDRSAYGNTSEYGKADPAKEAAKAIAVQALRQPTVTPSSSTEDIKTLQRALNLAVGKKYALKPSGKAKDGVDGNWGSDTTEKLAKAQGDASLPKVQQTTPEVWIWLFSQDRNQADLALKALKAARLKAGAGAAAGSLVEGVVEGFTRTVAPPPAADATPVSGEGAGGSTSDEPDYVKWGLIAGGVVVAGLVIWALARRD